MRIDKTRLLWVLYVGIIFFMNSCTVPESVEIPNILWITSEDNSPYLGCYGDPQAKTPHTAVAPFETAR